MSNSNERENSTTSLQSKLYNGFSFTTTSTHYYLGISYLNLHPASHIVTSKICTNYIQHVHREGSERDWFLILIMPSASEFASLIPNLLHLGIVLDDDGIFEKGSGTGICSITIQSIFGVSSGAARIDADVKLSVVATQSSWQMYAIDIAVNKKQNMNTYVNIARSKSFIFLKSY